jgi:4-amino-4-deoxy-L-arabinose transferase-like glycosyltransferase
MSDSTSRRPDRATAWLVGVLVLAALLRAGALAVGSGHLTEDRDDYLVVARHYVTYGFWHSFENIPDSFRPPLLPLVMAALLKAGGGSASLGVFQLVLGTATVALTWHIGRRLGLGGLSAVAAAVVALDPLLVEYTTFPMTETLFTFLVTLFIALATPKKREAAALRFSTARLAALGAVFGASALCRPTIWPVAGLVAVWLAVRTLRGKEPPARMVRGTLVALLATVVVVSPWVIRNGRLLGSPVLTTTHGGYTLLLGNNAAFLQQVAARPLWEEWHSDAPDRFQQAWFGDLIADMDRDIGHSAGEMAADRWMYRRAWHDIAAEPRLFLRACLLRCAEFWNVVPLAPSRSTLGTVVVWGVGVGYALELLLFLAGLTSLARRWDARWMLPLLLILNFMLVHLVYWSNMRMRAPLVPLIALVAARGLGQFTRAARPTAKPPSAAP